MSTYSKPELKSLGSFATLTKVTGDSAREDYLVFASRGETLSTGQGYLDSCVTNPVPVTGDPCL